jgi:hypothetical protein
MTWIDSKSVCLDLKSQWLPNEIEAWKIKPFIPVIKMCYKCGRHGHLDTRCNGKERYLTCVGNHPTSKGKKYSKEARYISCGGHHIAFSKDCGKRQKKDR